MIETAMLQGRQSFTQGLTLRDDAVALGMQPPTVLERSVPLDDMGLKLQGDINLVSLNHAVRLDLPKEVSRPRGRYMPRILSAVIGVPLFVMVDVNAALELTGQLLNDGTVCNAERYMESEAVTETVDRDAAFSIEQTGDVLNREHSDLLQVSDAKVAKSGDTRCPAREGAEGQSRTKQESFVTPGVRNEYGPPPEGMMYSGLGGNAERATEMIAPVAVHELSVPHLVTNRNSKFLYAVVDNQRFFRPTEWMPTINQDGKVMRLHLRMNYVCSNRMLQGKVNWS